MVHMYALCIFYVISSTLRHANPIMIALGINHVPFLLKAGCRSGKELLLRTCEISIVMYNIKKGLRLLFEYFHLASEVRNLPGEKYVKSDMNQVLHASPCNVNVNMSEIPCFWLRNI